MFYKKGLTLYEHRYHIILECLKEHNFNRTKAAKALGISLRGLRNFILANPPLQDECYKKFREVYDNNTQSHEWYKKKCKYSGTE